MIFEALYSSCLKGELMLVDGGYCRWHLRRDRQLTILEIISTKQGTGSFMLGMLKLEAAMVGANYIVAKCPHDLPANDWWKKKGFELINSTGTKTGRTINTWRLPASSFVPMATQPLPLVP